MKNMFVASALSVFLVACTKQGVDSGTGSSAPAESGTAARQEKKEINSAAKEAERQVKDAASAQEKRIEAQAKAAKAQVEANKAQAEATAKAENKDIDEQTKRMKDAVGSAQPSATGKQQDDKQLL